MSSKQAPLQATNSQFNQFFDALSYPDQLDLVKEYLQNGSLSLFSLFVRLRPCLFSSMLQFLVGYQVEWTIDIEGFLTEVCFLLSPPVPSPCKIPQNKSSF
jgi:hypothetical protein